MSLRPIRSLAMFLTLTCSAVFAAHSQSGAARRVTQKIDETRLTALKGHVVPAANAINDRGPADPSERAGHIMLLLARTDKQQRDLDALVDQMHNRRSANYHKWLKPAEFGRRFEPADEDVAAVKAWLESKGLTVEEIPPSKTHITFSGTFGQLQQAFHIEIHRLSVNGEAHLATMNEPQVPLALAPVIAGFHKLNDIQPKPQYKRAGVAVRDPKTGKSKLVEGTHPRQSIPNFDDSGGTYEVGPQDFYTIYDENPLLAAGVNGAGQTVAVLEEVTVDPADVNSFRAQFGLPTYPATPNATQGGVNYILGAAGGIGGDAACTAPVARAGDEDEEGEADLDLQWAGTVAPNATVDFVACGPELNTGDFGSGGVDHAAQHVVNYLSSTVTAASLSYGWCESRMTSTETTYYSNQWEQFAAEGITAIVSSGDSGTTACNNGSNYFTVNPSVNGLGSTAYNVSAGGTDFGDFYESNGYANTPVTFWWGPNSSNNGSALTYVPEISWGGGCSSALTASIEYYDQGDTGSAPTPEELCNDWGPFVEGGSGGVSTVTTIPTWQSVYGVGLYSGSTTYRTLPDVSLFAAGGWWYHSLLFCQSDQSACTTDPATDSTAGGTSFVAPMLDGLMALVNQSTGDRQGQADYTFYAHAAQEYGMPGAPNSGGLAACSGSGLGPNVGSTCIFQDIAADTPSLQGGTIASDNVQPCAPEGITDCYASNPADEFGLTTIPGPSSSTPAYTVGAGYDVVTGLGSVNIANLVNQWGNLSAGFASSTALGVSAGTIGYGGSVTLTATVTATGRGGAVAPAGMVQFYNGTLAPSGFLGEGSIVPGCTGSGASTVCNGTASYTAAGSTLNPGSNNIYAVFEGDGANDVSSTSAGASVTVNGWPQTVILTAPSVAVYGTSTTLSATASSGLTPALSVVSGPATLTGSTLKFTGAGNVIVQAIQAGNGTYAAASASQLITVSPAVLKIAAYNYSRVYATALPASFLYSVTGFVNGDTQSVVSGVPSITTPAAEGSAAGTYPITPAIGSLSATNYTFVFQAGTLTITQAVLKVAAFNYSRVYATALPSTFLYSITGFVNGDTQSVVNGAPSITTTGAEGSGVGTYPITPALGSLASTNYSFVFQAGTLSITPAVLKVAAYNYSRVYATALPTSYAYSITGFVNGDMQSVVTGAPSITTTAVLGSAAGTYPITATLGSLATPNYTFVFQAGTLAITQAVLKVAAFNYTRVYATALPTSYAYSITGFVNGDTQSVVSGTPNMTTTAVEGSGANTYPITPALGSLSAANYTFVFQTGTLTITKAVLKVAAFNYTRAVGAALPTSYAYSVTGFVNGDTAASSVTGVPSITTTAVQGSPAGTYPIAPTIGSLAAANYSFTFADGTLTITN